MPGVFQYYICKNCGCEKRLRNNPDPEIMKKKMSCCDEPDPKKRSDVHSFFYTDTANWAEENIDDKIREHAKRMSARTRDIVKNIRKENNASLNRHFGDTIDD